MSQLIINPPNGYIPEIARAYAYRGEVDRAFEWLEKGYAMRHLTSPKKDPFLKNLWGDPRYTALLKKMNLDR